MQNDCDYEEMPVKLFHQIKGHNTCPKKCKQQ